MTGEFERIAKECTEASEAERIRFPEVVAKLAAAGVERYHADLVRGEKIYYLPNGESLAVPGKGLAIGCASTFVPADVEEAVRGTQRGEIQYREFCRRLGQAGCVGYFVSLAGRRVVYYGRTGEAYVEPFPAGD